MKKISFGRRSWLLRRQKIRQRSAILRANVAHIPPRCHRDAILAPAYFCILPFADRNTKAVGEFFAFLQQVRGYKGSHLSIDMSQVTRLVATATLAFKAELSYLRAKGVDISGILPKKERIHQVLTQTGLCDLLGLPRSKVLDREDIVHWTHASGTWTLAEPDKLEAFLRIADNPHPQELFRGMIESVSNCVEHAYQEHPQRRHLGSHFEGWWGFQQLRNGELTTCIFDIGIGIANALPIKLRDEPGLLNKLMAAFRRIRGKDVQSISAAIEYGRTSTGLQERGKGLRDAHKVIDSAGNGQLMIISNRGMYVYTRERGKIVGTTTTRALQGSMHGTMYLWRYPLLQSSPISASGDPS